MEKQKKKFHMIEPLPKRESADKWDVHVNEPFKNCERIHPLQQKKVAYIINDLKKDENIKNIIIFGSSVTEGCHVGSDVDLYVELQEKKKVNMPLCNFVFDLWTNYSVDDRLLSEINKKGVSVYGS